MNHEQALALATAPYAESFTDVPILAAAALEAFSDELVVLRHACRSKRFTGILASQQGWFIANRLRAALVLDGRLASAMPLAALLENAADDILSCEEQAPESFARLAQLLAKDARRISKRIVKTDPSSIKQVMQ